jgi:hypothetical protein
VAVSGLASWVQDTLPEPELFPPQTGWPSLPRLAASEVLTTSVPVRFISNSITLRLLLLPLKPVTGELASPIRSAAPERKKARQARLPIAGFWLASLSAAADSVDGLPIWVAASGLVNSLNQAEAESSNVPRLVPMALPASVAVFLGSLKKSLVTDKVFWAISQVLRRDWFIFCMASMKCVILEPRKLLMASSAIWNSSPLAFCPTARSVATIWSELIYEKEPMYMSMPPQPALMRGGSTLSKLTERIGARATMLPPTIPPRVCE